MVSKSKFRNIRTNGYASQKEFQRSQALKLMQKQGLISDLQEQVRYPLTVNGIKICAYICDFKYMQNGKEVVEDVKSNFTKKLRIYQIKKKLLKACYGIDILET